MLPLKLSSSKQQEGAQHLNLLFKHCPTFMHHSSKEYKACCCCKAVHDKNGSIFKLNFPALNLKIDDLFGSADNLLWQFVIFADKSANEEGGILLAQLMTLSCLLAAIFYLINGLKSSYTLQAGVVLLRYLMIGPPLGTPINKLRKSRQKKGSNQLLFATSLFGLRSSITNRILKSRY